MISAWTGHYSSLHGTHSCSLCDNAQWGSSGNFGGEMFLPIRPQMLFFVPYPSFLDIRPLRGLSEFPVSPCHGDGHSGTLTRDILSSTDLWRLVFFLPTVTQQRSSRGLSCLHILFWNGDNPCWAPGVALRPLVLDGGLCGRLVLIPAYHGSPFILHDCC